MPKHPSHLLELARKGAEHRLAELRAEIAELVKVLPRLEFGAAASPSVPRQKYGPAPRKRQRRKMSTAERKAVSQRMKRYWAARKAGKKK